MRAAVRIGTISLAAMLAAVAWRSDIAGQVGGVQTVVVGSGQGRGRGEPPPPPPPVTRDGLIVGRVLDAGTGRPVTGAIVTLNGGPSQQPVAVPPGAPRPAPTPPPPPPRLFTDNEGRFAFRFLTRGNYSLSATKPGYSDGAYGRQRPGGPARSLQLIDHERVGDLTIRVFKFGAIAGAVIDEGGEPVVGVQVRAYRRALVAGKRVLQPTEQMAATDDRGLYRFGTLMPGEYVIALPVMSSSAPAGFQNTGRDPNLQATMYTAGNDNFFGGGGRPITPDAQFLLQSGPTPTLAPVVDASGRVFGYGTRYYPSASTISQAQVITIRSGEERAGIDFAMQPSPTATISGVLLGPDGPAANYVLHLVPSDTGAFSFDPDVATAITDGNGAFMFLAIPAGQYVIQTTRVPRQLPTPVPPVPPVPPAPAAGARPPSFSPVTGEPVTAPPPPPEPTLWTITPVALGGADIPGLVISLREGLTVSGRVEFSGGAERPNAQRLAQIPITIEPADARQRSNMSSPPGRLTAAGTFSLPGFLPGKYLVRIGGAPPGWTLQSAMYHGVDVADTPLDLTDGDAAGIVITFTDRMSSLSGTVRGLKETDEAPAVIVFPADRQAWKDFGYNPRRMRMSRASVPQGAFGFGTLPPGDYYLAAIPDEFSSEWQDPAYLEAIARVATRVTMSEGERRVEDVSVQPVKPPGSGGQTLLRPGSDPARTGVRAGSDPGLTPTADHGPYVDEQTPVQVPARDRALTEKPGGGSISGVIVDENSGAPIRKVRVSLRSPDLRSERLAITDDNGRFNVEALPPGLYTIVATKPAYLTAYYGSRRAGRGPGTTVTLAAGQKITGLAVKMPRGGVITGTIVDPAGLPYPNARIRIGQFQVRDGERTLVTAGASGTLTTDDRGVYRAYGLMTGSYTISVVPSFAGVTTETRQLSGEEMRAALTDLKQAPPIAPIATGDAGRGRVVPPAPPGPLPDAPLSGRAIGYSTVHYPGTVIEQDAGLIPVTAGQEVGGIDIALVFIPTARIEGSVTLPDGRAPERANLSLISSTANSTTSSSVRLMPDGKFLAMGVAPGRYTLAARVVEEIRQVTGQPYVEPALNYWAQTDLTVYGEDIRGVSLTMSEGLTISGQVRFERKGTTPIPDGTLMRVSLQPTGASRSLFSVRPVPTDASGVFTLTGVTPGRYRLIATVNPEYFANRTTVWYLRSTSVEGRNALDLPFDVLPGRSIRDAAVVFTDQATELSGTITNAAGAPVTDLMILLFATDRTLWTTSSRMMRPSIRPGPDGKYTVLNVTPGEYFLAAVMDLEPSDWGDPAYMEQIAAGAIRLTIAEGEKKVQDLRTGGG